jgi:hypothetical protein
MLAPWIPETTYRKWAWVDNDCIFGRSLQGLIREDASIQSFYFPESWPPPRLSGQLTILDNTHAFRELWRQVPRVHTVLRRAKVRIFDEIIFANFVAKAKLVRAERDSAFADVEAIDGYKRRFDYYYGSGRVFRVARCAADSDSHSAALPLPLPPSRLTEGVYFHFGRVKWVYPSAQVCGLIHSSVFPAHATATGAATGAATTLGSSYSSSYSSSSRIGHPSVLGDRWNISAHWAVTSRRRKAEGSKVLTRTARWSMHDPFWGSDDSSHYDCGARGPDPGHSSGASASGVSGAQDRSSNTYTAPRPARRPRSGIKGHARGRGRPGDIRGPRE